MHKILLFLSPIIFIFSGCKQDDITPAWLHIDQIGLTTNEVTQGENSHNITDAWVYMDGVALGVFELPAKIPVLGEGNHDFVIFAGIKNNGISATRTDYPFYERFDTTLNLTKNEITEINPVVQYKQNVQFEMIEDFEGVGIEFVPDVLSDTTIIHMDAATYPDIVKWGNNCGGIFLNQIDSIYKGATTTYMDLPKGEDVYMEIDYYNTNSLTMGVIANYSSGEYYEHTPLVLMNPQDESEVQWKKIYIDLKEDVSVEINAVSYEIFLLAIKDPDLVDSYIYVDNIKIVRYQ